jgi:hypothetical protein
MKVTDLIEIYDTDGDYISLTTEEARELYLILAKKFGEMIQNGN